MTAAPERSDAPPVLWSLNGLRAAGALLVMLYHVNAWNLQVIRGTSAGFTGVGLFFVLSGFVLTWTARPGTTMGAFWVRRLARIYPNHLVGFVLGMAVTVVLTGAVPAAERFLPGLVLLQSWSPDRDVVFAVNGVAWSLSCEIAFYLVFPVLLWWLRRRSPAVRWTVAFAALATPALIGALRPELIPVLFHFPPARLPEFLLGMVTALAVQEGWRPRVPATASLALLAAGILCAARFDLNTAVVTAVLAAVFAPLAARCAQGDIAGGNRWARHPAVMLAGALSFAFYLVHELVIKVLVATPLRGPVTVPVVLVVSAVLAYVMWRGVELPGRRVVLARLATETSVRPVVVSVPRRGPRHGRPRAVAWSYPVRRAIGPAAARAELPAATTVPAGVPGAVVVVAAAVAESVAETPSAP